MTTLIRRRSWSNNAGREPSCNSSFATQLFCLRASWRYFWEVSKTAQPEIQLWENRDSLTCVISLRRE
jgi:hypothetical protein